MQLSGQVQLQDDHKIISISNDSNQISGTNQKTLDEPISETILRDLNMIGYKLKYVLLPKMREDKGKELRKWDLWGPLLMCLTLSIILSIGSKQKSESIFALIFMIVWFGAFIVTLNAKLLKGNISFFQSICVLGYCIFPINIVNFILMLIGLPFIVKFIMIIIAFIWSSLSSVAFMSSIIEEKRKLLAVYPVVLFYLFLSWFVLLIQ